jgi:iron(III) transport system substrate-binding protein
VDTYEELASPRFRGKLCVRSSDNIYNLSLVGALIEAWGEARAGGMGARHRRQSGAVRPKAATATRSAQVGAGVCEVAITNSYYYIRMSRGEPADRQVTERVKLAFPSLTGRART